MTASRLLAAEVHRRCMLHCERQRASSSCFAGTHRLRPRARLSFASLICCAGIIVRWARSRLKEKRWTVLALGLLRSIVLSACCWPPRRWFPPSGCPALLATGIYVLEGGNMVPAECEALEGQRVVVMCRPPSSHEYRHAGASRNISQRVSELLVENVKDIDVVNPREVDNWVDESDWGDFRELAEAVRADMVVHIELDDFDLYKGKTLYQGRADVTVTVYDMKRPQQARVGHASWAKCSTR